MFFHMRTTLILPDHVVRELKRRAARTGRTLSDVVAETLRRGLGKEDPPSSLPPLPVLQLGKPLVDVANREALYRAMEDE